jgi:hypothetical protein
MNNTVVNLLKLAGSKAQWLAAAFVLLCLPTSPMAAQDAGDFGFNLQTSLWTTHFRPQPEHNNTQRFLGVERLGSNPLTNPVQQRLAWAEHSQPLLGYAYFKNSFHQSSTYAYAGFRESLYQYGPGDIYLKVSAGLIRGYRGDYRDKVPLNQFGIAPAVIPSLGIRYRHFNAELIQLGVAGLMLNAGFSF